MFFLLIAANLTVYLSSIQLFANRHLLAGGTTFIAGILLTFFSKVPYDDTKDKRIKKERKKSSCDCDPRETYHECKFNSLKACNENCDCEAMDEWSLYGTLFKKESVHRFAEHHTKRPLSLDNRWAMESWVLHDRRISHKNKEFEGVQVSP